MTLQTATSLLAASNLLSASSLLKASNLGPPTPPPSYTTGAVNFDGGAWYQNPVLGAPVDNGILSYFMWVRLQYADYESIGSVPSWVIDVNNSYTFDAFWGPTEGSTYITHSYQLGLENTTGGALTVINYVGTTPAPFIFPDSQWVGIGVCANTNLPAGEQILTVVANNVVINSPLFSTGAPFIFPCAGTTFDIGLQEFVGKIGDFWFAPGIFVDFADPATLAKFIDDDNCPVDLGADGSSPGFGVPSVFYHQPVDSTDPTQWLINRGSGGALVNIAGAITYAGIVTM